MTRGHNIVADGWAGASNPPPHPNDTPNPPSTHSHINNTHCSIVITPFSRFQLERDGRTNGPTDQRTDKASYRVACPQLKSIFSRLVDRSIRPSVGNQNKMLAFFSILLLPTHITAPAHPYYCPCPPVSESALLYLSSIFTRVSGLGQIQITVVSNTRVRTSLIFFNSTLTLRNHPFRLTSVMIRFRSKML